MKFLIVFTILFLGFISCTLKTSERIVASKYFELNKDSCKLSPTNMNGVSFENVSYAVDSSHVSPIKDIHASWITTMPFAFIKKGEATVKYGHSFQWYGETREGIVDIINLSHQQGLKVMLKPHVWARGTWVGDIEYSSEEEWKRFEKSYAAYILSFAYLADSMKVEAFCIGVELKKVVVQRPQFWIELIDSVRSVYSGPLTYAANWDNYENVTFWNKLDFIGIDAYFPVSSNKTPSVASCYNGWENDFNKIKAISKSTEKKVIFTEFGYRNIDYTGQKPWNEEHNPTTNSEGQVNAYKALFCRFWGQSWFEGGFLWKWHPEHLKAGGDANNRFTPQNKPVEQLISDVYSKTN